MIGDGVVEVLEYGDDPCIIEQPEVSRRKCPCIAEDATYGTPVIGIDEHPFTGTLTLALPPPMEFLAGLDKNMRIGSFDHFEPLRGLPDFEIYRLQLVTPANFGDTKPIYP